MRAVVAGGSGFLGSHLCRRLITEGFEVVCVDSLITGERSNLDDIQASVSFIESDVAAGVEIPGPVDWVCNLASPASPPDYLKHPVATLEVGSRGTMNLLGLARDKGARYLQASTSEIYGDPEEHPQRESYWGKVNPVGPRSVYDEAKRFGEAATMAFHRHHGLETRIIRIFNTYGPYMRAGDGRAVPNFIAQSLAGEPLSVHGDGSQTRSLCYVDDLIEGIWRSMRSEESDPVNLGSPEEVTVLQLAELVRELSGSESSIHFEGRPIDDPERRCPDITKARDVLGWAPVVPLREGLSRTIAWFKHRGF